MSKAPIVILFLAFFPLQAEAAPRYVAGQCYWRDSAYRPMAGRIDRVLTYGVVIQFLDGDRLYRTFKDLNAEYVRVDCEAFDWPGLVTTKGE